MNMTECSWNKVKSESLTGVKPMTSWIFIHLYSLITTVLLYVPGNFHSPHSKVRSLERRAVKSQCFYGKHEDTLALGFQRGGWVVKTKKHPHEGYRFFVNNAPGCKRRRSFRGNSSTLHLVVFLAKEFRSELATDTSHLLAVTFIASCCSHWTSLRSINSP